MLPGKVEGADSEIQVWRKGWLTSLGVAAVTAVLGQVARPL